MLTKPLWLPWELNVSVSENTQNGLYTFEPGDRGRCRIKGVSRETLRERVDSRGDKGNIRVVLRRVEAFGGRE